MLSCATNLGSVTERNEGDSVIWDKEEARYEPSKPAKSYYNSPSCIVVTIVVSECLTTSNTLSPLLSARFPVFGSAGIDASLFIEPETSMTQQMSSGARRPTDFSELAAGCGGGVTVMRTLLSTGSEEREMESMSLVMAVVADEAIEFGVPGRICMVSW